MKIATRATGGICGYLAANLVRARDAHLDAIRRDGLTLERSAAATVVAQPWKASVHPADFGAVDTVRFAVKALSMEDAATTCLPMPGPRLDRGPVS